MMRNSVIGVGVLLLLVGGTSFAHGQKEAERYIPLGQSPGLSGTHTVIGEIKAVNAESRTVSVAAPSGTRTATVTDRTRIWLDRSRLNRTTLKGGFDDLRAGSTVEVKYEDTERKQVAEWIKVEVIEPAR